MRLAEYEMRDKTSIRTPKMPVDTVHEDERPAARQPDE
jgi:hypothetical protein